MALMRWTPDGLVAGYLTDEGVDETRYFDAYGRLALRRIKTADGRDEFVTHGWDGAELVLEAVYDGHEALDATSKPGWTRTWTPGTSLDRPVGWTLACEGDACARPPMVIGDLDVEVKPEQPVSFAAAYNRRGDPVAVVTRDGTVVETARFDVHGEAPYRTELLGQCSTAELGTACRSRYGNSRGMGGARALLAPDWYHMRARPYSARLRTFGAPDPLGTVDAFDLHLYVGGDPLNAVDPFGLELDDVDPDPNECEGSRCPDPGEFWQDSMRERTWLDDIWESNQALTQAGDRYIVR